MHDVPSIILITLVQKYLIQVIVGIVHIGHAAGLLYLCTGAVGPWPSLLGGSLVVTLYLIILKLDRLVAIRARKLVVEPGGTALLVEDVVAAGKDLNFIHVLEGL